MLRALATATVTSFACSPIDFRLPALYHFDARFVALMFVFFSASCAFMLLLLSLQRKCATFLLVLAYIGSSFCILYCMLMPEWLTGEVLLPEGTQLTAQWLHGVNSATKGTLKLGLDIGLDRINITLSGSELWYDEVLSNVGSTMALRLEFQEKLERGLPYPLLSVMEQVAGASGDCFLWPLMVLRAGNWCMWTLRYAFVMWTCSAIFHPALPHIGAYFLTLSGIMLVLSSSIYWMFLKNAPYQRIYVSGHQLRLQYGLCFWIGLFAGTAVTAIGCLLTILGNMRPKLIATAFNEESPRRKVHSGEIRIETLDDIIPHYQGLAHTR